MNQDGGSTIANSLEIYADGFAVQSGGTLSLGSLDINTDGTLEISGGSLDIGGNLSIIDGTIDYADSDRTITVAAGARFDVSNGQIINALDGTLTILGSNSLAIFPIGFDPVASIGTFSNEGITYTVGSTLIIENGKTIDLSGGFGDPIQVEGNVNIGEGLIATNDVTVTDTGVIYGTGALTIEGGSLGGVGQVNADVQATGSATVNPGSSPGILSIDGSYSQEGETTLAIELGGFSPGSGHDRIDITGTASLDGTLILSLVNDFEPTAGVFEVLTYGDRSGDFSSVEFDDLPAGLLYELVFDDTAGSAVVVITAPGDVNRDNRVDAADLAHLLANWGQAASLLNGDFDFDNVVGVSDLAIMVNQHAVVPDSAMYQQLSAVPEPSAIMLAMIALVGFLASARRRQRSGVR